MRTVPRILVDLDPFSCEVAICPPEAPPYLLDDASGSAGTSIPAILCADSCGIACSASTLMADPVTAGVYDRQHLLFRWREIENPPVYWHHRSAWIAPWQIAFLVLRRVLRDVNALCGTDVSFGLMVPDRLGAAVTGSLTASLRSLCGKSAGLLPESHAVALSARRLGTTGRSLWLRASLDRATAFIVSSEDTTARPIALKPSSSPPSDLLVEGLTSSAPGFDLARLLELSDKPFAQWTQPLGTHESRMKESLDRFGEDLGEALQQIAGKLACSTVFCEAPSAVFAKIEHYFVSKGIGLHRLPKGSIGTTAVQSLEGLGTTDKLKSIDGDLCALAPGNPPTIIEILLNRGTTLPASAQWRFSSPRDARRRGLLVLGERHSPDGAPVERHRIAFGPIPRGGQGEVEVSLNIDERGEIQPAFFDTETFRYLPTLNHSLVVDGKALIDMTELANLRVASS